MMTIVGYSHDVAAISASNLNNDDDEDDDASGDDDDNDDNTIGDEDLIPP